MTERIKFNDIRSKNIRWAIENDQTSKELMVEMIDEIDRQREHIEELQADRSAILAVLDEIISEAQLQNPFTDEAGMAMLHGAKLLLEKSQFSKGGE